MQWGEMWGVVKGFGANENKRGTQTQEQRHRFLKPCYKREISRSHSFYLQAGDRGVCYLTIGRLPERDQWIKLLQGYWRENIHPRKNLLYYVGSIRGNICIYPRVYYKGSG